MRTPPALLALLCASPGTLDASLSAIDMFPVDGPIAGQTNGAFNWDGYDGVNTATVSDWDNVGGAPSVISGELVTNNSSAKREFNGPIEGAGTAADDGNDDHERSGAVRATGQVYFRFIMKRSASATWSGASSYDFGTERVFFGCPAVGGNDDNVGIRIQNTSGANLPKGSFATAWKTVDDNEYNEFVGVIDFDNDLVGLFLNPSPNDFWIAADGSNSADAVLPYTATNWSTAVRLGSGGTANWSEVQVADNPTTVFINFQTTDSDMDGLPDGLEEKIIDWYADDGVTDLGDVAGDGSTDFDGDGIPDSVEIFGPSSPVFGDSDGDNLDDGFELSLGTDPTNIDTDGDGIRDDHEVAGFPATGYTSNPLLVDTDGDGQTDSGEQDPAGPMYSDPSDPNSTAGGNVYLIGFENFAGYDNTPAVGSLSGLSGGIGFDYENWLYNGPFIGHTGTRSDWDGDGRLFGGTLYTTASTAIRDFNGPGEGPGSDAAPTDARMGAVNQDPTHSWDVVYFKVGMSRDNGSGATVIGVDDFGSERIGFGIVDNGLGSLQWGIRQGATVATDGGAMSVEGGFAWTLVGKLDYANDLLTFWRNPNLSFEEGDNVPTVTMPYTGSNWCSGVRLTSEGAETAYWDDLVVATRWDQLGMTVDPTLTMVGFVGPDTLRFRLSGVPFNKVYHLRESPDLIDWQPVGLVRYIMDRNIDLSPVDPASASRKFYRLFDGPQPSE